MNANTCPQCGYDHVEGDGVDIGRDHAVQECCCSQCGCAFQLIFKLVDKEILEPGGLIDDGPDQSDREPSHGPDYWRDPETGEHRLG